MSPVAERPPFPGVDRGREAAGCGRVPAFSRPWHRRPPRGLIFALTNWERREHHDLPEVRSRPDGRDKTAGSRQGKNDHDSPKVRQRRTRRSRNRDPRYHRRSDHASQQWHTGPRCPGSDGDPLSHGGPACHGHHRDGWHSLIRNVCGTNLAVSATSDRVQAGRRRRSWRSRRERGLQAEQAGRSASRGTRATARCRLAGHGQTGCPTARGASGRLCSSAYPCRRRSETRAGGGRSPARSARCGR